MPTDTELPSLLSKAPTGITGFDELTGDGLPVGRTTLLLGGPGSGKTIFALGFLAHGSSHCAEPGIFVAFEETADRIRANAQGFGWNWMRCPQGSCISWTASPAPMRCRPARST